MGAFTQMDSVFFMLGFDDNGAFVMVVDKKMKPISFSAEQAKVLLMIPSQVDYFLPIISLHTASDTSPDFKFVNDSFALFNGVVYPIEHVGRNYMMIPLFQELTKSSLLEPYLSVFYSYFENIQLYYPGYKFSYSSEELYTQTALVFEKVAADKSLYKTVLNYAPNKKAMDDVYLQDNFIIIPSETAVGFIMKEIHSLVGNIRFWGLRSLWSIKLNLLVLS